MDTENTVVGLGGSGQDIWVNEKKEGHICNTFNKIKFLKLNLGQFFRHILPPEGPIFRVVKHI